MNAAHSSDHTRPDPHIVVVGLGYVGLPLAVALSEHFETTGIDIDQERVEALRRHCDSTNEVSAERLAASRLLIVQDLGDANPADIYIIAVPTPVDANNAPDLSILEAATRAVAPHLDASRRSIVCYESTVYPGATEEFCGPILEAVSGLKRSRDFVLGYSPERINPGDREHTIDRVVKVVAGEDDEVVSELAGIYGAITSAGTYAAPSIKVAEAAKVIENAQRDLNIAFMNEIAQIFSAVEVSVWDVLEAARTKWNFLPFEPGLVGGHCIGVDPYYLAHRAKQVGHDPRIILAGREINDGMAQWVADRIGEQLAPASRMLVLGLTFKEDLPDLRNTKVADLIARLRSLGHRVDVADPYASRSQAKRHYGLELTEPTDDANYDAVVVAVPHRAYRTAGVEAVRKFLSSGGLLVDIKGVYDPAQVPSELRYWRM